jgi:uncharacterized protein YecE (DUF72 family)
MHHRPQLSPPPVGCHPLRVGTLLIGTTSWTEKTLLDSGLFYPPSAKSAEARLRFYAEQFPIVEVDSSYYGLPSERNSALWARRTPPGFVFDVKAFRLFTLHQTPLDALPAEVRERLGKIDKKNVYYDDLPSEARDDLWERFRSALGPLRDEGKLGAVVFQFPPWVMSRRSNLEHVLECARRLPGDAIAVEFRNKTWFDPDHAERTLAFEREHGLANVIVDEPQGFTSSIPAVWEVTTPSLAVVRLHGRNRDTWEKKGLATAAERFDYRYSSGEMKTLAGPIAELGGRARTVHVLFNNCYRDHAQANAAELAEMLSP